MVDFQAIQDGLADSLGDLGEAVSAWRNDPGFDESSPLGHVVIKLVEHQLALTEGYTALLEDYFGA